jgi:hypothetical protein
MKLNKTTKIGLGITGFGILLAIMICVISLSLYERVFFFDGYEITAIGWGIVIISVLIGCITIICGCVSHLGDYSKAASQSSQEVLTNAKENAKANGAVYFFEGVRGRILTVYEDKVIITTRLTAGSFITGNATDGEKTIYFVDCIGIHFKKSDMTLGYIQFETASGVMNNKANNMFNENSFTWDLTAVSNETMEEVANYVKRKIDECKRSKSMGYAPAPAASTADELKKFKDLLDAGIITQEEFDAKKKQLLGL